MINAYQEEGSDLRGSVPEIDSQQIGRSLQINEDKKAVAIGRIQVNRRKHASRVCTKQKQSFTVAGPQ